MKTFCTILLLFSWTASLAGQADLSWTAPTLNDDGTQLTDLAGYKMYWGLLSGTYPYSQDIPDPLAVTTIVPDLLDGVWYFVATAYDTAGNESVYSNEVSKTVVTAPAAPGLLTVTNLTAYTIVKQRDKFVLFAVGTVPANTTCNPNQSVNGFYSVPTSSVDWGKTTIRPVVVVADCS